MRVIEAPSHELLRSSGDRAAAAALGPGFLQSLLVRCTLSPARITPLGVCAPLSLAVELLIVIVVGFGLAAHVASRPFGGRATVGRHRRRMRTRCSSIGRQSYCWSSSSSDSDSLLDHSEACGSAACACSPSAPSSAMGAVLMSAAAAPSAPLGAARTTSPPASSSKLGG